MFRMLVFLVSAPLVLLMSKFALVYISSGYLAEGLPFAAVCLMCGSYFVKGAAETIDYVQSKIK